LKGAVVFHSRYGNNRKVALAIATGLEKKGHRVELVDARAKDSLPDLEFLVVGSPTRIGKMSRPIKKFLENNLKGERFDGMPFAAFGTCLESTCEKGEGSSAKEIYSVLSQNGLSPGLSAFEAGVTGMKGPLGEGYEESAVKYGQDLGTMLQQD
jgi:menaquinone-dependent protoporphyrinogen IX oxidase